ncbi:hypothetical protein J7E93_24230 [Streptomyces sp. ISL-36]|uniref:hypothetical protein n=1 Tax=Streptomyces sp. ISL-36 TaxID=2819182 RepID=UPI001BE8D003|nr:hypothetical protein [Streptomyces sp. ISL-36]MBT2443145.1 hypothetical protein [Streptomyces sp. ISL-36]
MPRPNAAQLAYGSATVVFSTAALLLLSRTTTTLGIATISVAGLLLGLLVTVTMPVRDRQVKTPVVPLPEQKRIRVPATRVGAGADTRIRS